MNLLRKIFSTKNLHLMAMLLVILQSVIDMDYLFYDFLDQFGLPRFSTIVRFIIIPGLILWSFVQREKNKKRTFVFGSIYGIALLAFLLLHNSQSQSLLSVLNLTDNFYYSSFQELTYVLTLVLPYGLMYVFYHEHFTDLDMKKMTVWTSALIGVPIFIGDLFVFGKSTYYGYTVANFFSWFTDIYSSYHPRTLASKFFFNEGNTIGILMLMVLPLMYYYFSKAKSRKEKVGLGVLIAIQSLSMQILSTRVATYGAVLIPIVFIVLYLFDHFLHSGTKILKSLIIYCICTASVFGLTLNFTPAVQNQKVDAKNDVALLTNGMAEEGMEMLGNAEDLIPGTPEYINFYVYMFEVYGIKARYIQSVPSMYYTDYYSYQKDPKFWVDVTFMPVYDRVSGRQIETIFFNYKYQNLTPAQKVLGMGYSTFMNGSIVLEQDFKQQVYTLGYAGVMLCCVPWLLVALFGLYQLLRRFKQMIDLKTMCLCVSFCAAIGSAWLSGHTLDQFVTSVFMALVVSLLLNHIHDVKEELKK